MYSVFMFFCFRVSPSLAVGPGIVASLFLMLVNKYKISHARLALCHGKLVYFVF